MEGIASAKQVQLVCQFAEGPFIIDGDEQQLEQALINIIKNAMEAITGGGTIICNTNISARQLTITDTGHGIAPTVGDQLFSPFYSTKKDGQGIGLTLVKEILLNHRFEFSLQTVEPEKTVFEIHFNS